MCKIYKYIFCLVVGLSSFFGGIVFGSGSNCSSYPPCDDGQEYDDDCQCILINSGEPDTGTQNPSQNPELGDPESGSSNQGNLECNQEECSNYGEIWSTGSCKCICDPNVKCCGIQLNTVVPFIGDCIEMSASTRGDTTSVTSTTAFPILMQGLMKILMSAIMVFSFLMVIVAGLSMTTGAFGGSGFTKGKTILKNVIISLILLGCSGLILSLVNPSFFGR